MHHIKNELLFQCLLRGQWIGRFGTGVFFYFCVLFSGFSTGQLFSIPRARASYWGCDIVRFKWHIESIQPVSLLRHFDLFPKINYSSQVLIRRATHRYSCKAYHGVEAPLHPTSDPHFFGVSDCILGWIPPPRGHSGIRRQRARKLFLGFWKNMRKNDTKITNQSIFKFASH